MIVVIIIGILMVSFLLALNSLRKLGSKKEIEDVKKDLAKGRVLYQDSSSSGSDDSSPS